jgi:hypothetical protein
MACALTSGYTLDCRNSFGGVKEIYIMEFDNATTITVSAGVVTAITKATGKLFRDYKVIAHTAEGEEAATLSRENGTSSIKQTIKLPINKMTTAVRNELLLLGQNRLLIAVTDENGTTWLYGHDYGLMLQTWGSKTGKTLADRNGYELVFEGEEKNPAYECDSSTVTSLTVAGS